MSSARAAAALLSQASTGTHFTIGCKKKNDPACGPTGTECTSTMKSDFVKQQCRPVRVVDPSSKQRSTVKQGDRSKINEFLSTQAVDYPPHVGARRVTYNEDGLRATHFRMDTDDQFESWTTSYDRDFLSLPFSRLPAVKSLQKSSILHGDRDKVTAHQSTMKSSYPANSVNNNQSVTRICNMPHVSRQPTIHSERTFRNQNFITTQKDAYTNKDLPERNLERKPIVTSVPMGDTSTKDFMTTTGQSYHAHPTVHYRCRSSSKKSPNQSAASNSAFGDGRTRFADNSSTASTSYVPHEMINNRIELKPTDLPQWHSDIAQGDRGRVCEFLTSSGTDYVWRVPPGYRRSEQKGAPTHDNVTLAIDPNVSFETTFTSSYPYRGPAEDPSFHMELRPSAIPQGNPDKTDYFVSTSSVDFARPTGSLTPIRITGDKLNRLRMSHFSLGKEDSVRFSTMKSSFIPMETRDRVKPFAPVLSGSSIPQGDRSKINEWATTSGTMQATQSQDI